MALGNEVPTDELEADQYELREEEHSEEVDKDAVPLRRNEGTDNGVFDVGSDENEDQSAGGRRRSGREKTGERRPLKFEDSDDDVKLDIGSHAGREPLPSYEKRD